MTESEAEARIEALEIKAAYFENLANELNELAFEQSRKVEALEKTLRQIAAKLKEAPGNDDALHDVRPPHY